jgi:hypothetical protein
MDCASAEHDPAAEESEAGAAIYLPLDHLCLSVHSLRGNSACLQQVLFPRNAKFLSSLELQDFSVRRYQPVFDSAAVSGGASPVPGRIRARS